MNATMNILSGKASTIRDQPDVPTFIKLLTFPEMAKLLAESDRYSGLNGLRGAVELPGRKDRCARTTKIWIHERQNALTTWWKMNAALESRRLTALLGIRMMPDRMGAAVSPPYGKCRLISAMWGCKQAPPH